MTPTAILDLGASAIALAERGWRVFPLHSVRSRSDDDGRLVCTCGDAECKSPGKHSALRGKEVTERATADVDTVKRWWAPLTKDKKPAPPRNIAVATGQASGILAIDVDVGGARALADLERRHSPLPETLEARTPTGGRHLYFAYPAGVTIPSSEGRLGPRLNVLADGGYLVAAPSLHAIGEPYTWANTAAPAELPRWVLDLLAPTPTVEEQPVPVEFHELVDQGFDPFAVCRGRVTGADVRPALEALAAALAVAHVQRHAIDRLLQRINERRCAPALPRAEVTTIALRALAERDREREEIGRRLSRSVLDLTTLEGQRTALEQDRLREIANPEHPEYRAIEAWIKAHWGVHDYDRPRGELRLVWLETGVVVPVPIKRGPADIGHAIADVAGMPDEFARRCHPKATGKLFLQKLANLLSGATLRGREDADSAAVQLVQTIRAMDVWPEVTNERGETKRWKRSLETCEGFFPDDGIGRIHSRGSLLLVVRVPKLVNGGLRSHPEFRGLTARQVTELLKSAPGALPKPVRPREATRYADTDYLAVDLAEFDRVVGEKSEGHEVIEIDSLNSRNGEKVEVFSGETAKSLRENDFPQDSRTSLREHPNSCDCGSCGKAEGKSAGVMDRVFSPEFFANSASEGDAGAPK